MLQSQMTAALAPHDVTSARRLHRHPDWALLCFTFVWLKVMILVMWTCCTQASLSLYASLLVSPLKGDQRHWPGCQIGWFQLPQDGFSLHWCCFQGFFLEMLFKLYHNAHGTKGNELLLLQRLYFLGPKWSCMWYNLLQTEMDTHFLFDESFPKTTVNWKRPGRHWVTGQFLICSPNSVPVHQFVWWRPLWGHLRCGGRGQTVASTLILSKSVEKSMGNQQADNEKWNNWQIWRFTLLSGRSITQTISTATAGNGLKLIYSKPGDFTDQCGAHLD